MSTKTVRFHGTVGGVTYTDPLLFERAAKSLGYRFNRTARAKWALGTEVALIVDDERVTGQVWSKGPKRGTVWLALSDGHYVLVTTRHGDVLGVYNAAGIAVKAHARFAA